MTHILRLLMEDRQRARAESEANIAALRQIAQAAAANRNNEEGEGHGEEAPRSRLRDFQNTNPPVFSKCTAPLDVDDWLRTIENNLEVATVGDNEKVLLATHFLAGPTRAWWENVKAMQAPGHVINWEEFTAKFRKAHIPTGLIKMKRDEFFNLKQNNSNVVDYLDKFNTLARYTPQDMDTDEKKRDRFMNGLHEEIQSILVAVPYPDLEALVDATIMVESKRKAAIETRKRKMQQQQGGPSSPKYRSPAPSRPANPPQRNPSPAPAYRSNNYAPNRSAPQHRSGGSYNNNPRPNPPARPQGDGCFACGKPGHFSHECPTKMRTPQRANAPRPNQAQARMASGKKPIVKKQANAAHGHLNHASAEEAEEAPDIVMASLRMAPCEALYGRRCRTPLNWTETGESQVFGPDILRETEEQVQLIRDRLRAAQSRQKSYADTKRRELTFCAGDFAYLRLELPPELSEFHDVFHVSQLRKCLQAPNKTEVFKDIDYRAIDLNHDLTYRENPIRILEEAVRVTRRRKIKFFKVQWSNHSEDEATWEREDYLRQEFPHLFKLLAVESWDEILLRGEGL
ncbi:hypothetical protein QYE76_069454 [Lolium multiflorum]|uniref:CCHC-type domain-containing protein n=1 Tax=Lolium multiflorum TaxID=4521 RepID=A0AAD8WEX3_LOLMU|nr:hypothetical protein QYE76_069454 [Lolium multiflorum]